MHVLESDNNAHQKLFFRTSTSFEWTVGHGVHARRSQLIQMAYPLFDSEWYLQQYPDVATAGVNPLEHYMEYGWREGRDPHPLFSTSYYLNNNRDVLAANINPLLHYMETGWQEGRDPHPLFSTSWYLKENPDVWAERQNPLVHYLLFGSDEGRTPHPNFDGSWYLAKYPDVAQANINPLVHFVRWGKTEGRQIRPACAASDVEIANSHAILAIDRFPTLFSLWHRAFARSERPIFSDDDLPPLTISVVLHNSERWIAPFLLSLLNCDYPKKRIAIVFVDNNSSDETLSQVNFLMRKFQSNFESIKVIKRKNNDGYGAGNDVAITGSTTEFVLVTNVDVEFHTKTLRALTQTALADLPTVACWEASQVPFEHPKYYDPVTLLTNWSSHACILIRKSAYMAVGGYEKRLFMYGEDVELSYRLRASGWLLRYVPTARITHHTRLDEKIFKPIQLSGSISANVLLRHRYGNQADAHGGELLLKRIQELQHTEERRKAIMEAVRIVDKHRAAFASTHFRGRAYFPFNGFDYDLVREGALHKRRLDLEDKTLPLVSIITRTMRGRQRFLCEAIASVLNQTYPNIEHVIVEDHTQTADKLIQKVQDEYGANLVYCRSPKRGRTASGNTGLSRSTGEFILFLDDDDLIFADHIEVLVQALLENPHSVAAYSLAWVVPTDVRPDSETYSEEPPQIIDKHRGPFDPARLLKENFAPIQSVLFRRAAYEQLGGFHEDMDVLEDWNLWVRYSQLGTFTYTEKLTSLYRIPTQSKLARQRQLAFDRAYQAVYKRNLEDLQAMNAGPISSFR